MEKKPVGAYRNASTTGWTAYDKDGLTWNVDASAAEQIEADRAERNLKAGKSAS
ncbi:hypothetical protein [Sulfitobacter pacificus]|uniref:Uncharacterized protein n=1 Tax=Sulfitobacter pacificus TaxID=1499314 RepID=A0ABQ5VG86_9RHOB|nr:hypothetical protein [Sulfitobacter pacificus]GLQ26096.1 hypothetical protein GCM10007927_08990 [Sulfitobacter pacificus]